jgi:hypothetical protein
VYLYSTIMVNITFGALAFTLRENSLDLRTSLTHQQSKNRPWQTKEGCSLAKTQHNCRFAQACQPQR